MGFRDKMIGGLKWTTGSTLASSISGIIKISVLTRFLSKDDFGLIAIVMLCIGFVDIFSDLGLTTAIFHKKEITKKEYSSIYWLGLLSGFILYGVLYLLTPLISTFYQLEQLNILIPILGLNLIFSGIGRQFRTIEHKNLAFKTVSIIEITAISLALFLSIYLATNNYGVYAIVYSMLFQYSLINISLLIFGLYKYGIKLHFKYDETKPFLRVGLYQVGGQILNYFNRDIDVILIGKFFSTEVLGGYSLVKQLAQRPIQIINPILNKLAIPALSQYQENPTIFKKYYLKVVSYVSMVNAPIYLTSVIFAPGIIHVFYGQPYVELSNMFRVLSVYMFLRAINNPVGSLLVAKGRTDLNFKWNLIVLLVTPVVIYFGSQINIFTLTVYQLLLMFFLSIISLIWLVNAVTNIGIKEYLNAIFNFNKTLRSLKNEN